MDLVETYNAIVAEIERLDKLKLAFEESFRKRDAALAASDAQLKRQAKAHVSPREEAVANLTIREADGGIANWTGGPTVQAGPSRVAVGVDEMKTFINGELQPAAPKRKRGRPPGSKNKRVDLSSTPATQANAEPEPGPQPEPAMATSDTDTSTPPQ